MFIDLHNMPFPAGSRITARFALRAEEPRLALEAEVHYLQDPYRGAVWEEVIIHLPPDVRLVCLSATVSNAEEFAAWVEQAKEKFAANSRPWVDVAVNGSSPR